MKISNNFTTSIHLMLRNLIDAKSTRDQIKFTSAQLANALCMPRSMITKLTHPDESKRVVNPRIDTLLKIVEFFKSDGFNITINDLLGITTKSIDVQNQKILIQDFTRKILLHSFNFKSTKKLGTIDMKVPSNSKNILALYADKDIKPFFKKGSIFIIDKDQHLEDGMLVAIVSHDSLETQIKKYHIEGNKRILKSLDHHVKEIVLMPHLKIEMIGAIIQVNAKT
ncbi:MAG: hypothetical protein A3F42_02365 [Gammaproteobacteria bacterium RIFCSPHIGHO2_12_FULL_37_34]|nr:MAG: hypothetical protein A3F42_02365 [Gammaproteobacteria bacterium RIFCSPHIGHO2_12_FULL_37_34]